MVLVFTNRYRNSKNGSSFLLIKKVHKRIQNIPELVKEEGLCIFLVRIFVLCISPPAFFSIFKNKKIQRRKEAEKEPRKRYWTINMRKQVPDFPNPSFRLHIHSTVQIQFLKIQFSNYRFIISAFQNQQIQIRQLNFSK